MSIPLIEDIVNIIFSLEFVFLFFLFIIFYHIGLFLIKDLNYIKTVKEYEDPEEISIGDLDYIPLVNIIIPAWKEGEVFKKCLLSIKELRYPKLKVIVNAGGSKETERIAAEYKQDPNFKILEQKGGNINPSLGKIRAINESLDLISEGLIYLMDADCYLTDEILLRNILPIINKNEDIVRAGIRPLKSQEKKDIVRYLEFKRLNFAITKYRRYPQPYIGGAQTCLNYQVIKAIGKFNEERFIPTEQSMGKDIQKEGFRVYFLNHYKSKIYTEYPDTFKELYAQRARYIKHKMINAFRKKQIFTLVKLLILFCISLYFIISPFLFLWDYSLVLFGLLIPFSYYLLRLRRFIFFKILFDKKDYPSFSKVLFLKVVIFVIFEIITIPLSFLSILWEDN